MCFSLAITTFAVEGDGHFLGPCIYIISKLDSSKIYLFKIFFMLKRKY
jgi:hypothetical protein